MCICRYTFLHRVSSCFILFFFVFLLKKQYVGTHSVCVQYSCQINNEIISQLLANHCKYIFFYLYLSYRFKDMTLENSYSLNITCEITAVNDYSRYMIWAILQNIKCNSLTRGILCVLYEITYAVSMKKGSSTLHEKKSQTCVI